MKKNAFTLIELLSVIVIFAITFLIVLPSMNSIIGNSEKREIELIEQRVLSAAKEYVTNIDGTFYKSFYKEGDTAYVYKSDLINAGLIDENEVSKLNTWGGVKGELLSNDKIRYTVEYINTSNNEYTNEELYLMMQSLAEDVQKLKNQSGNNGESVNSEDISNLQTQISNLTNKDNINNVFLQTYPVGSIYVTNDSTNPGTKFGGTWVSFGAGRTLVGVDSSQTEFATLGLTGGEKTHTLTIAEMPSHNHYEQARAYGYSGWSEYTTTRYIGMFKQDLQGYIAPDVTLKSAIIGLGVVTDNTGSSQSHNNLQPYITVYMWKRTA